jgi:hypothetical protein
VIRVLTQVAAWNRRHAGSNPGPIGPIERLETGHGAAGALTRLLIQATRALTQVTRALIQADSCSDTSPPALDSCSDTSGLVP